MEDGREGDMRVSLIFSLFCIFVVTGGIFLIIYVFVPDISQPWFPVAALVMIGSPWVFWFMTYLYTCIKGCCRGYRVGDRQISSRHGGAGDRSAATPQTAPAAMNTNLDDSHMNSPGSAGRKVHFGAVVVMEGDGSRGKNEGRDSSVTSSKECEMPLTLSVSS